MNYNDVAWEKLFETLKIEEALKDNHTFVISAKQINEIGQREARLMAKFDTKEALPKVFKDLELNINATSNGFYLIFKDPNHQSFINLPDYKILKPKKITPHLDFNLETLTFSLRMSESNAIDFAHHANILSIYSGEKDLKLTTRGRFFSEAFDFNLSIGSISVKGVQVEVDAGYEGREQFLIIEAKSSTRSSFNIRQLYYPFRHFQSKTNKRIRTILLSFSNGIYYFTEIELSNDYYDYKIVNNEAIEIVIEKQDSHLSIEELLNQSISDPTTFPVPQADDINKVIDLVFFLLNNPSDKFKIASFFEFNDRQGDYYGNAAAYIGLAEKNGADFQLTVLGKKIAVIKNRDERNIHVISAILKTKLFNDLYRLFLKKGNLTSNQIVTRLENEGLTGKTPERRKSTIASWINWINNNVQV